MKPSRVRRACALTAALLAPSALVGCGAHDTFVRSDDSSLGRVVVYRNGIAYYERKAEAADGKVTLTVPQDKVNDFLKSLTVTELRTGKPVPVSYPTAGATVGDQVQMTIQVPPDVGRDLQISYITDSPAWKPSYRVVVDDAGKVNVQGWAIVDNTSGEDWEQVRVGVGASSALSFRYDLRSVMHVHRETLGGEQAFAHAPPTGGATHKAPADEGLLLALAEEQVPRPAGHPTTIVAGSDVEDDLMKEAPAAVGRETLAAAARPVARKDADQAVPMAPPPAPEDGRIQGLANRLKSSRETVVVEGYVPAGGGPDQGLDQANRVRNRLVELGVAPDRVQVSSKGFVAGKQGVELRVVKSDQKPDDDGQPVGESHFDSGVPMTVARGTSAMVAVMDASTEGEVVYVYNPDADRGDDRYAFRAVRFKNPTDSTLETGPVTVYGAARFIGEGLTDAIPPHATALIPYALDRQVKVDRTTETHDRLGKLVEVKRGVMTVEVRHVRTTTLEVHNRSHAAATVFLRYDLPAGWTLGEAPKVYESQGRAACSPSTCRPTPESPSRSRPSPLDRTVDLRSTVGLDLVRDWLSTNPSDGPLVQALSRVVQIHDELMEDHARMQGLRERMDELRARSAELTDQIQRLAGARGGESLRQQLAGRLADMERRIQEATLEVVQLQEKQMLARIRFQDGVAELSMPRSPGAVAQGR
ncbi:MAG: hypothetical protein R3F43_04860 [bacterium]